VFGAHDVLKHLYLSSKLKQAPYQLLQFTIIPGIMPQKVLNDTFYIPVKTSLLSTVPYSSRLQVIHRAGSGNCDRSRLMQYVCAWLPPRGRPL
jgi:hypothetical protein